MRIGRGTLTWVKLEARFGGGFKPFGNQVSVRFVYREMRLFTYKGFYTGKGLHTGMGLRREMILQRDASTYRCSYTEILSTQRCFYTMVL